MCPRWNVQQTYKFSMVTKQKAYTVNVIGRNPWSFLKPENRNNP